MQIYFDWSASSDNSLIDFSNSLIIELRWTLLFINYLQAQTEIRKSIGLFRNMIIMNYI